MALFKSFVKLCRLVEIVLLFISRILLMLMFLIIVISVFCRYVLFAPIQWSEEVTLFMMIWMGLIGMALALDYEDHVSISFLVDKLNPKLKKIIKYISEIVLFYFLFIVIKEGFVLALESNAKSYMLQYPIKYSLLSVPVCFLLMFIFLIKNVLRRVFSKRQSYPSMDRINNKGKEEAL